MTPRALLVGTVLLCATEASAIAQGWRLEGVTTAGLLGGLTLVPSGLEPRLGVEATHHRPLHSLDDRLFAGGFVQGEWVGFERGRFALGPQVSFMMFGLEVGPAFETGRAGRASRFDLQVAPFASFLVGSLAARFSLPLGSSVPQAPTFALVLTLKFPYVHSSIRKPGDPLAAPVGSAPEPPAVPEPEPIAQ